MRAGDERYDKPCASWHRARRTRMLTAYQFTFLPSWRQKAETLMHWEP
ncbi:MAG TPA: hypothetical protein VGQ26_10450 [Streptosporangiaceae bacterium]|nr:hypothetical protein [Streptosporangiaceae bacterium]